MSAQILGGRRCRVDVHTAMRFGHLGKVVVGFSGDKMAFEERFTIRERFL